MPSWNDGETSTERLSDFVDSDYAPEWIEDPTFRGVAVDCPEVCRVHKLEPLKVVAFQGINTGRRFYLCPVQDMTNCGFVAWLDQEWPVTAQNALGRLWDMYHESNSGRIDDRIENARMLKELATDKNKMERKCTSMMAEMKKFLDTTEKNVMEENWAKMNDNNTVEAKLAMCQTMKSQAERYLVEMEKERNMLRNELFELKQVDKCNMERIKMMEKKWEQERNALKEDKKKTEYMLHDLFKATQAKKDKLKRIKEICEE